MLAGVPLLGLLPATAILNAAGDESLAAVAAGELRPAYVPARPPGDGVEGWTVEPRSGIRAPQRRALPSTARRSCSTARSRSFPMRRAPSCSSRSASAGDGSPVAAAVAADADGVSVEPVMRYDATRSLGHVSFSRARGRRLAVGADVLADAWYLAHALIAAESLGAVQTCLDISVAYAKERFTFGRAIGSYQAIKHELTEVLRQLENARGLQYYAGWARESKPEEFPLAASAARAAAGHALDFAARSMINVHGGIGATWEHDAPLFFRRAQLVAAAARRHPRRDRPGGRADADRRGVAADKALSAAELGTGRVGD